MEARNIAGQRDLVGAGRARADSEAGRRRRRHAALAGRRWCAGVEGGREVVSEPQRTKLATMRACRSCDPGVCDEELCLSQLRREAFGIINMHR
jgi:hypothetical protein